MFILRLCLPLSALFFLPFLLPTASICVFTALLAKRLSSRLTGFFIRKKAEDLRPPLSNSENISRQLFAAGTNAAALRHLRSSLNVNFRFALRLWIGQWILQIFRDYSICKEKASILFF